jgi:hypothetical protein
VVHYRKLVALTTAQHNARIRQLFPQFQYAWERGTGIWSGTLQPQEEGAVYHVRIAYKVTDRPRVKVTSPAIRQDAKHLYPGGELCLYYPKDRTWHSGLHIAETIIPMTAEWLLFYELWLESGKWWGPEAPHSPQKQTRRN